MTSPLAYSCVKLVTINTRSRLFMMGYLTGQVLQVERCRSRKLTRRGRALSCPAAVVSWAVGIAGPDEEHH